jgi:hypothetical protein
MTHGWATTKAMRGRPPRPIGVPGDPDLTELRPGVWQAKVRVRDASGKPRQVMRTSPPRNDSRGRPVPDGADINTTIRHYLARGKVHPEAADVLDRALQPPADSSRG